MYRLYYDKAGLSYFKLIRSLKEVKPDSKHTVLSLEHQLEVDVQCTTFRINVVHTTIYIHNYSSQFRNLTAESTQTVGLTLRPAVVGRRGSFGLDWFGGL